MTMSEITDVVTSRTNSGSPLPNRLRRQLIHSESKTVQHLESLPLFKDTPNGEHDKLLITKLDLCCTVFDFRCPEGDEKGKAVKLVTLQELSDYFNNVYLSVNEKIYPVVCRMFAANVFRILPPSEKQVHLFEEPEIVEKYEPSWSHLELVYGIFLQFLSLRDIKVLFLKKYINKNFIIQLVNIFNSEDPRERGCVKTIFHKIYSKISSLRSELHEQISNVFSTFIYETEDFNGIAELLEVVGSTLAGCDDTKQCFELYLRRYLLPLHKVRKISTFHAQLAYCTLQFIEKDNSLLETFLSDGLFRFWPKTYSMKEVMFIYQLQESLEVVDQKNFNKVIEKVVKTLAHCFSSSHFQIAEQSLSFWMNEHFLQRITPNIHIILPIVLPSLTEAKYHWHVRIQELAENSLNKLRQMDPEFFKACILQARNQNNITNKQKENREIMFAKIEKIAHRNQAKKAILSKESAQMESLSTTLQSSTKLKPKAPSENLNPSLNFMKFNGENKMERKK